MIIFENFSIGNHITAIANHVIDGLAQACSNSIANALELLQPCAKPSIWILVI